MRKNLRTVSLLAGAVFTSVFAIAQQSARIAWATTDVQNQNGNWVYLRQLNMENGQFSDVLLNGALEPQVAYDAATKKPIEVFDQRLADRGYSVKAPFSGGVAALALDKRNNRLWFTPMFIDQLRYIDLKTMKLYYVNSSSLTGMTQKSADQGNIVTRMVIASDGKGYAMTNDGMHLLQFTTGKNISITDLGAIVDDQANKNISIHNSCSSFGGDIIADDEGNLFVFSARNHVFRINTETKVATHLGSISGLPANFTVNGAAVTADNKVIVASAMEASSYFYVDMKSLAATPYAIQGTVWHSSDLASANQLSSRDKNTSTPDLIGRNTLPAGTDQITIYPNPVTENQFRVQFGQVDPGNYTIVVTDVTGRQVVQQAISISGERQNQTIKLSAADSRGIYLVKVMDAAGKAVYSSKVVVQ